MKMRAIQISKPGGPFELVERDLPEPGPGQVRLKILACGVCHSDVLTKEGHMPGIQYPRIPGHEMVGTIDAVGVGVNYLKPGQRAGVGWHGGHCGTCDNCRRGDLFACDETQVTGIQYDGGYATHIIARATGVALLPEDLSPADAAPLMCAGVTTFNALRNSGARPGDLVAVLGLGGLGHLGVQYAVKMGFKTVAIARGQDKAPLAKQLGAWRYLDSQAGDPAAELKRLGGAKVVLATVTDATAMASLQGGLGPNGALMVLGAPPQPLPISAFGLIGGKTAIRGWYSGTSIDSQDTVNFSLLTGVRSMNEPYPLEKAAEAYDRMLSGKARFRVVLTIN